MNVDAFADTPRTLGRYELLHPLASGGMATVFLGRSAGIGGFERLVAIKVCHPHLRGDAAFASMFLDEARLAARIHHPNVVSVLDVGDDGALFFVMEYIEGVALSELMRSTKGPLPLPVVLRIARDLLAGLHAAHETRDAQGRLLNVVHRDVSPQNVLVGCDGIARVVDFGVAKAEARATVTKGGVVKGKIGYMPPEQFLGTPVERQADVYAAAIVIWECLTGERLFDADSDAAVMNLVLRGHVRPWPTHVTTPPAAVSELILRALRGNAAERFASAAEMLQAIEAVNVQPATPAEVGLLVQEACATKVADRRQLVLTLNTKPHVRKPGLSWASNTLIARLTSGKVLIVSRKWVWGAAILMVVVVCATYFVVQKPRDLPASMSSQPTTAVIPAPVQPALATAEQPRPTTTETLPKPAAVKKPKAIRKPPTTAKRTTSTKRGEFRPTEL